MLRAIPTIVTIVLMLAVPASIVITVIVFATGRSRSVPPPLPGASMTGIWHDENLTILGWSRLGFHRPRFTATIRNTSNHPIAVNIHLAFDHSPGPRLTFLNVPSGATATSFENCDCPPLAPVHLAKVTYGLGNERPWARTAFVASNTVIHT